MRSIKTILFVLLGNSLFAQIKPYAGIEYFPESNITLESVVERTAIRYDTGDLALIYGIGYNWNKFQFKTEAKTSMYLDELASYTPSHSEYSISASYQLEPFRFKIEHACYHPMQSFNDIPVKIYGGYVKLGIYWNYKP